MPEAAVHVGRGKVREIYELGSERLVLVASDRISTFDVVLPTEIPDKGRVLTGLSAFWFRRTADIVPNHLLAVRPDGRAMEVTRLRMLPIECVVRGYLAGSGWKDYQATGATSGHALPTGMRESERLPEPIFTAEHAAERGIIIADTKFEFGLDADGELVLGDEALTPDSSRFWPADEYRAGGPQPSFDKQYVRDYCETLGWDKTDPGPELPDDVVAGTRARYVEAFERLTGVSFDDYLADPAAALR